MTKEYNGEYVWIIGASSGIGLALAKELDSRGATLALSARSKDELDELNTSMGGRHKVFAVDVTEPETLNRTAQAIRAAFGTIDKVVYLAAAYAPMKIEEMDLAVIKKMLDVNIMGAFNLTDAILPIFKNQKNAPQLALCGSVAGYLGLPGGQPYSATKAAIANLAETLKNECGDYCDVKLISPGFVKTPLTDKNKFKMPMMISPNEAAEYIADGLMKKGFEVHFPKKFTILVKFLNLLPYCISMPLAGKIKP